MNNYFSLGQKVSHQSFGNGIVTEISKYLCSYPVQVMFDGFEKSFTFDGKYQTEDQFPSLSQSEHIPIILKKVVSFNPEELVWVKSYKSNIWNIRYYAYYDREFDYFFLNQEKSGAVDKAFEIRKFNDNPLT